MLEIVKMAEVEVNGLDGVGSDLTADKEALSSSSTSLRTTRLQILEERLLRNGKTLYIPPLTTVEGSLYFPYLPTC